MSGITLARSRISRCGASPFVQRTFLHSAYALCCCLLQIRPLVIWSRSSHQQLFKLNRFPGTLPAVYRALLLFQVYSLLCLMMLCVFTESSFFRCCLMRRTVTKAKAIGGGDEKSLWLHKACCKKEEGKIREEPSGWVFACVCFVGLD